MHGELKLKIVIYAVDVARMYEFNLEYFYMVYI
jgi:hypothetical protein